MVVVDMTSTNVHIHTPTALRNYSVREFNEISKTTMFKVSNNQYKILIIYNAHLTNIFFFLVVADTLLFENVIYYIFFFTYFELNRFKHKLFYSDIIFRFHD